MKQKGSIINKCAATIRNEMRAIEKKYNECAAVSDRLIARDISIKLEDVPEEQLIMRKKIWRHIFKEEYDYLQDLIYHIDDFDEIQENKKRKELEEFFNHLQTGTLAIYNFKQKDD